MKNHSKAFSLIELSIVILIVGILIAGVLQGSKLYNAARLAIAQNLTKNSPANNIPGLQVWWETSMAESFKDTESEDNLAISAWYDIGSQSLIKTTATQSSAANKPVLIDNAFSNGIRGLRFTRKCPSGTFSPTTSSNMTFDGSSFLPLTDLTIFAVAQKRSPCNDFSGLNPVLSGLPPSSPYNVNLFLGWRTDTQPEFFIYSGVDVRNGGTASLAFNGKPTPLIYTAQYSMVSTSTLRINGAVSATSSASSGLLTSFPSGRIGGYGSGNDLQNTFNGDIGEIIIFTRALTNEEVAAIELYLSQKYRITIS